MRSENKNTSRMLQKKLLKHSYYEMSVNRIFFLHTLVTLAPAIEVAPACGSVNHS